MKALGIPVAAALVASQLAIAPAGPALAQDGAQVADTSATCGAMYGLLIGELDPASIQYRNSLVATVFWQTLVNEIAGEEQGTAMVEGEKARILELASSDEAAQSFTMDTIQNCMAKETEYRAAIPESNQFWDDANYAVAQHVGSVDHVIAGRCAAWYMIYAGMIESDDPDSSQQFNEDGMAWLDLSERLYTGSGSAGDAAMEQTQYVLTHVTNMGQTQAAADRVISNTQTCQVMEELVE